MSERQSTNLEPRIDEVTRHRESGATNTLATLEEGKFGERTSRKKDEEIMDRHDAEVNTILVFSGLLAATVTAFFIFIQPQLQQDPNTFTATLLFVFINATNSTLLAENGLKLDPKWSQTSPSLDLTQGFLLGSLLCTLLCVLGGVFTKIIPNSWVKFWLVDLFLRTGYVLVYLLLAAAFVALFIALNAAFPFKNLRP